MTAAEIRSLARTHGVTIRLDGGDLGVVADREPDADLLAAIAAAKPQIVAVLRAERGRINHWIASRIITWAPDRCFHCRQPIVVGSKWTLVAAGDDQARFHEFCHAHWLVEQEVLARRALGLDR
jgi:hypothetical protein